MFGVIFAIGISLGLPAILLIYAIIKKQFLPFLLGVLTFVGSQMLIRIPILQIVPITRSLAFYIL